MLSIVFSPTRIASFKEFFGNICICMISVKQNNFYWKVTKFTMEYRHKNLFIFTLNVEMFLQVETGNEQPYKLKVIPGKERELFNHLAQVILQKAKNWSRESEFSVKN